MVETITAVGMVISQSPISEYDKRLVILTKEFGKITAFARGARKPNSQFLGGSQPMAFGEFTLYRGRNAYTVTAMKISDYFSNTMHDIDTLELLYFSMKELSKNVIPKALIRCIYELKTLVINGEYPNVFQCAGCGKNEELEYFDIKSNVMFCKNCHGKVNNRYILNPSSVYTLQYIITSPINKLYTFTVKEEVLSQIVVVIEQYLKTKVDKKFNSLDFL